MAKYCDNCGGGDGKHAVWCYNNVRVAVEKEMAEEQAAHEALKATTDPVNRPAHYTAGSIECIDYMQDVLTPDEFRGYLRGQVIKYQHRLMAKGNPAQDAAKLAWYANRLAAVL